MYSIFGVTDPSSSDKSAPRVRRKREDSESGELLSTRAKIALVLLAFAAIGAYYYGGQALDAVKDAASKAWTWLNTTHIPHTEYAVIDAIYAGTVGAVGMAVGTMSMYAIHDYRTENAKAEQRKKDKISEGAVAGVLKGKDAYLNTEIARVNEEKEAAIKAIRKEYKERTTKRENEIKEKIAVIKEAIADRDALITELGTEVNAYREKERLEREAAEDKMNVAAQNFAQMSKKNPSGTAALISLAGNMQRDSDGRIKSSSFGDPEVTMLEQERAFIQEWFRQLPAQKEMAKKVPKEEIEAAERRATNRLDEIEKAIASKKAPKPRFDIKASIQKMEEYQNRIKEEQESAMEARARMAQKAEETIEQNTQGFWAYFNQTFRG